MSDNTILKNTINFFFRIVGNIFLGMPLVAILFVICISRRWPLGSVIREMLNYYTSLIVNYDYGEWTLCDGIIVFAIIYLGLWCILGLLLAEICRILFRCYKKYWTCPPSVRVCPCPSIDREAKSDTTEPEIAAESQNDPAETDVNRE